MSASAIHTEREAGDAAGGHRLVVDRDAEHEVDRRHPVLQSSRAIASGTRRAAYAKSSSGIVVDDAGERHERELLRRRAFEARRPADLQHDAAARPRPGARTIVSAASPSSGGSAARFFETP